MDEIQPADARARRTAVWIIGVAAVLGMLAILVFEYFRDDFQAWLEQTIDYLLGNLVIVFVAAVVFVSPVIAAGIYLFLFGNRIVRSQRFPPPDISVTRDTRVFNGPLAIRRGRFLQFMSLVVIVAAGAIPYVIWKMLRILS